MRLEPQSTPAPAAHGIRVAWVAGPETPASLGRTLQPLAIGLMDEMIDLVALCPQEADVRDLPSPPLEVIRYTPPPWWSFGGSLDALSDHLRKRRVVLVHALETAVAELARRLARDINVPYVVSTYSLDASGWLARAEHQAWAVLAGSEPVRNDLLAQRVSLPDHTYLVRPGVYQVRHATCFTDPQLRVVIVAGGRMDDYLAFDAVLRSFAELRGRGFDCVFFLMGDGRAERLLRARSEKLGLRHDLTFVDWQSPSQLSGIFKAADIYVSPAPSRQVDIYSLLAMAAGVPVLAATSVASDFIIEGKTALLFTTGDSEELTAKLVGLLDNHPAAGALAESALEHLRVRHSPAGMVTALAEIYRQAAQPANARAVETPARIP